MCNPVAVMAVGMAMKYTAERQAAERQRKEIGRAQDRQDVYHKNILDTSLKSAEQYNPTARTEANTKAQDAATESLRGYLDAAKAQQPGQGGTTGNVSSTFTEQSAQRTLDDANRSATVARLFGKLRGATDLRAIEGLNNADASSRVATLSGNKWNMARASDVDIAEKGTPNPMLMLIGSMMSGYGGAMTRRNPGQTTDTPQEYPADYGWHKPNDRSPRYSSY